MSRSNAPTDISSAASRQPRGEKPWLYSLRRWGAAATGMLVLLAVNRAGVWWLCGSQFSTNAFYDGWAACLTLALPAFLGGLCLSFIAPARRIMLAFIVFGMLSLMGSADHWLQVPLVSPQSAHSGAMHYFLHSPLCLLTFGLLGAWLAEQFALGRFTLADKTPVTPAQMGDD